MKEAAVFKAVALDYPVLSTLMKRDHVIGNPA